MSTVKLDAVAVRLRATADDVLPMLGDSAQKPMERLPVAGGMNVTTVAGGAAQGDEAAGNGLSMKKLLRAMATYSLRPSVS